jgi:hypothetical protein
MKMRPGGAAGGADGADENARLDRVADRDGYRLQMKVAARHTETVIDDHGVAGEIEIPDEDHAPARHLAHRRALAGREVDAIMGRARLPVQDALAAIDTRHHAICRANEGSEKPSSVRVDGARFRHLLGLALDSREDLRRRRHHLLGQPIDALDVVTALLHLDAPL